MRHLFAAASIFALTACGLNGTDDADDSSSGDKTVANSVDSNNLADTMASRDPAKGEMPNEMIVDPEERPTMQAQVVLDRRGFGPGVIDGAMGMSTENALRGFQEANDLKITGKMDEPTKQALAGWNNIPATRVVTIPAEWAEISFAEIPDDAAKKAEMDRLGYSSLDEKLAERFHTTVAVLKKLNPDGRPAGAATPAGGAQSRMMGQTQEQVRTGTRSRQRPGSQQAANTVTQKQTGTPAAEETSTPSFFIAGQQIRVPNVGADRISPDAVSDRGWQQTLAALGVGTDQPAVAKIVVSEKAGTLRAFDKADKLVALFTVTSGSKNDPLPLGEWAVNGVGRNPTFSYNPELFWDVPDDNEKLKMPPGPNGPVGVVWIDLTKEHYGIHGTPAPETIGRVQSHGCVRLTNWDAARLAGMVSSGTKVLFEA